ncbi:MAG: exodeoxyribonuclease VII large subunit [Chloroflexi bacterium]|nr:exodeoxyribonuclease VII large subunit [Chloroflexota bacterium]
MQSFSVQEITRYIHELFDADDILADVRVRGEVSNLTKAASGHWYFTLKDAKSQLRCVMFRSAARFVRLDVKVGDEIVVLGRVSVYEARGEYQLYANAIEALGGVGDLHQQFEALKTKLDAEGLFDQEKKHLPPPFPGRIGIVTSPDAAAYQDILNVLSRRFPLAEVILSPTIVQGADAPAAIVAALARLYARDDIDVIIVARGGGSIEDLWCFNDETVARTIAASRVPVISGIGHEIDFTIADFVADLRAPTPSAAAELATPNQEELLLDLDRARATLNARLSAATLEAQRALQGMTRALGFNTPLRFVHSAVGRLDGLGERIERVASSSLERLQERLAAQVNALEAANPEQILARGYALVSDESGEIVRSAAQVRDDQRLQVRFHRDQINVRVEQ